MPGDSSPLAMRLRADDVSRMAHFRYRRALTVLDAARQLQEAGAAPLGGGTDLLVQIAEGLAAPDLLVDLRAVEGAETVEELPDGAVRMGGGARLHHLARTPLVSRDLPMLAQACDAVGTSALRHMGTLGGNLCQRPRCWYLRRGIPCHKNGGDSCPAREGENQYHAILGGGPCWIVHPSDPAVALTALDAQVVIAGSTGERTLPVAEFFVLPSERLDRETVLAGGEFVSAVIIPPEARGGRQRYRKLMQRGAWDFALCSLAAARRPDGEVRLVLGGVAPRPWRLTSSVEEDVAAGGLDEDSVDALAERALYDAEPLAKNGYKVQLAVALLREAMRELGEE